MTDSLPIEEKYCLISQIRRASSSIPTNIAEGCGRGSDADFKRFLQFAFGSASEVEYLLLLCKDLNYINEELYENLNYKIEEIKMMLGSLIIKLRTK
jgi:four helix bundle protein